MTLDATVARLIAEAAQRSGVGQRYPGLMERVAVIESAGNPEARNPSGAAGLYQFMPGTARQYGLANPYDPAASADAAARLTLDNAGFLSRRLGRDPTGGELYLAHQQGAGGASKLLANPDARAADLVGVKAVTQNGGRADETAAQFAGRWINKVDGGSAAPTMTMPSEAGGSPASGRLGIAGIEPSASSAPTMTTPEAKKDDGLDVASILKLMAGDGGLGALAQPAAAQPPAAPSAPPMVPLQRRAVPFDRDAFLALLRR